MDKLNNKLNKKDKAVNTNMDIDIAETQSTDNEVAGTLQSRGSDHLPKKMIKPYTKFDMRFRMLHSNMLNKIMNHRDKDFFGDTEFNSGNVSKAHLPEIIGEIAVGSGKNRRRLFAQMFNPADGEMIVTEEACNNPFVVPQVKGKLVQAMYKLMCMSERDNLLLNLFDSTLRRLLSYFYMDFGSHTFGIFSKDGYSNNLCMIGGDVSLGISFFYGKKVVDKQRNLTTVIRCNGCHPKNKDHPAGCVNKTSILKQKNISKVLDIDSIPIDSKNKAYDIILDFFAAVMTCPGNSNNNEMLKFCNQVTNNKFKLFTEKYEVIASQIGYGRGPIFDNGFAVKQGQCGVSALAMLCFIDTIPEQCVNTEYINDNFKISEPFKYWYKSHCDQYGINMEGNSLLDMVRLVGCLNFKHTVGITYIDTHSHEVTCLRFLGHNKTNNKDRRDICLNLQDNHWFLKRMGREAYNKVNYNKEGFKFKMYGREHEFKFSDNVNSSKISINTTESSHFEFGYVRFETKDFYGEPPKPKPGQTNDEILKLMKEKKNPFRNMNKSSIIADYSGLCYELDEIKIDAKKEVKLEDEKSESLDIDLLDVDSSSSKDNSTDGVSNIRRQLVNHNKKLDFYYEKIESMKLEGPNYDLLIDNYNDKIKSIKLEMLNLYEAMEILENTSSVEEISSKEESTVISKIDKLIENPKAEVKFELKSKETVPKPPNKPVEVDPGDGKLTLRERIGIANDLVGNCWTYGSFSRSYQDAINKFQTKMPKWVFILTGYSNMNYFTDYVYNNFRKFSILPMPNSGKTLYSVLCQRRYLFRELSFIETSKAMAQMLRERGWRTFVKQEYKMMYGTMGQYSDHDFQNKATVTDVKVIKTTDEKLIRHRVVKTVPEYLTLMDVELVNNMTHDECSLYRMQDDILRCAKRTAKSYCMKQFSLLCTECLNHRIDKHPKTFWKRDTKGCSPACSKPRNCGAFSHKAIYYRDLVVELFHHFMSIAKIDTYVSKITVTAVAELVTQLVSPVSMQQNMRSSDITGRMYAQVNNLTAQLGISQMALFNHGPVDQHSILVASAITEHYREKYALSSNPLSEHNEYLKGSVPIHH